MLDCNSSTIIRALNETEILSKNKRLSLRDVGDEDSEAYVYQRERANSGVSVAIYESIYHHLP